MSELSPASPRVRLSRRSFLEGLGLVVTGLALELELGATNAMAAMPTTHPPLPDAGFRPNVFVHLAPDGWVTMVCHRSEMGQHVEAKQEA